jgi:hypothetical protein
MRALVQEGRVHEARQVLADVRRRHQGAAQLQACAAELPGPDDAEYAAAPDRPAAAQEN